MAWQYTPYVIPMVFVAVVCAALALFAWSRRQFPGAPEFLVLMIGVLIWSMGYALELAASELAAKQFWALVKYLGVVLVSPAFLVFALRYSGKDYWVTPRIFGLLAIEPIAALLLLSTNDFHHLMWTGIRLEEVGGFKIRVSSHGIAFWVHAFYGYLLLFLATFLLLRTTLRKAALYRSRAVALLVGVLTPLTGNALYLTRLNPFHPFDLTPFSFVITGLILAFATFRLHFLNVVPVAHEVVLRGMRDAFIVLDALDRVVELNSTAQTLAAGDPQKYTGRPFVQVFAHWPELIHLWEQSSDLHNSVCPNPKRQRSFEVQNTVLLNQKGRTAGQLLVLHDITEHLQAEALLRKTHLELENRVQERTHELQIINQRLVEEVKERRKTQSILLESEERYRQLVEQPFDGVYVLHGENIIYINTTGAKLLSAPKPDDLIGRSILDIIHPDYREFASKRINTILREGLTVPLAEEKFIRFDGEVIDVEVAGASLRYEGLPSVLVVFRDITERKAAADRIRKANESLEERVSERTAALEQANLQLQGEIAERERVEEQLRKAKGLAEAANQAKSEFLANMSHELRTPLNAIIGFTELVVDGQAGSLNETQREYLHEVLGSSRHLLSLINDVLDLAKVEAGKMDLEIKNVSLRDILEGSLVMVKEKALKHRIQVTMDLNGVPGEVEADERKLKQVFYNLLSNAVKFTPDGGRVEVRGDLVSRQNGVWLERNGADIQPPADIDIDEQRGRDWVFLSVADTGIGIQARDLDRIFFPFAQVDGSSSRRYAGTGLGLSLARQIVELHGGKIWAESEGLGKGSRFRFAIPLRRNREEGGR